MDKPEYRVASLSGGKDSTAMLLMMLERGMQIDRILYCDTGMDFPAMYDHLDKLERYIGMPITRIRAEKSFLYYLLECEVNRKPDSPVIQRHGEGLLGHGWAGPKLRWCTSRLKTDVIKAHLSGLKKDYRLVQYVGIAADEPARVKDLNYPLVDWGVTEEQALAYCYEKGFDFGGLYELFDRVSCWCCPLQGLAELRTLRTHFPELWQDLLAWDKRCWRQFRADYSVEELDTRFAFEEERLAKGEPIKGKAFFTALYRRLGRSEQDG